MQQVLTLRHQEDVYAKQCSNFSVLMLQKPISSEHDTNFSLLTYDNLKCISNSN